MICKDMAECLKGHGNFDHCIKMDDQRLGFSHNWAAKQYQVIGRQTFIIDFDWANDEIKN